MAASRDYAVLDLQNNSDDLGMDLQFQDFGEARTQPAGAGGSQREQTIHFSEFPDSAADELEQEKLMGESESGEPAGVKPAASFWTFEFYQQFFDVESKQVGDRILWSMVPKPGVSYLQSYIRPNPDLYGPFWICTTLAFTTAITGNLANYLATTPEDTYVWRYEFRKVTLAASAIFAYAWLIPLAVWGLLVWRGSRAKISLLELLCIYGYSLAIFVPVSILWMVPQDWFKWCLAIVAPILSGSVLVRTVWPSLSHDSKKVAISIAVFILVLHATLALGFMLYFFTAPTAKVAGAPINISSGNSSVLQPSPKQNETGQPANVDKEDKSTLNSAKMGTGATGKKSDVDKETIKKSVRDIADPDKDKVKDNKADKGVAVVQENQKISNVNEKNTANTTKAVAG
ncbi:protein YIPF1 isoform X3 [Procambarus clarkii]|uniref:protein YIPF1 isoform X3 n=1 Tax=Procambarus clarkii TaxID=6728 RepID=UPI001E675F39|nr:protein YIPF1-like isoform X3 [Procambarus clarkii]